MRMSPQSTKRFFSADRDRHIVDAERLVTGVLIEVGSKLNLNRVRVMGDDNVDRRRKLAVRRRAATEVEGTGVQPTDVVGVSPHCLAVDLGPRALILPRVKEVVLRLKTQRLVLPKVGKRLLDRAARLSAVPAEVLVEAVARRCFRRIPPLHLTFKVVVVTQRPLHYVVLQERRRLGRAPM